jgi:hypothetical protein
MLRVFVTLALALCMPALSGAAQQAQPSRGSRIRWESTTDPGNPRIGAVLSLSTDTLVAMEEGDSTSRVLSTASLTSLELSNGSHNLSGRYAVYGAIGGGVGAIAGARIVDWAANQAVEDVLGPTEESTHSDDWIIGLVGAAVGAAIGATIGATRHTPEHWTAVDLGRVHGTLTPGGARLWLTVRE